MLPANSEDQPEISESIGGREAPVAAVCAQEKIRLDIASPDMQLRIRPHIRTDWPRGLAIPDQVAAQYVRGPDTEATTSPL